MLLERLVLLLCTSDTFRRFLDKLCTWLLTRLCEPPVGNDGSLIVGLVACTSSDHYLSNNS